MSRQSGKPGKKSGRPSGAGAPGSRPPRGGGDSAGTQDELPPDVPVESNRAARRALRRSTRAEEPGGRAPGGRARGAGRGPRPGAATRDGEAEGTLTATQRRWWRVTVVAAVAVVAALGVVTAVVLAGQDDQPNKADPAVTGVATASPEASEEVPAEPGRFARPSLSGTDAHDPWKGARPISDTDLDAMKRTLKEKYALEFNSRPTLGGVRWSGITGDAGRKQRRFDAVVEATDDNTVFHVMCQAGGTELTAVDAESLAYVTDCLMAATKGENQAAVRTWLDQNLRATADAGAGGGTWVALPSLRMYVESRQHVISCALTNS